MHSIFLKSFINTKCLYFFKVSSSWVVVAHAFNPKTQREVALYELGASLIYRVSSSKTLSQKTKMNTYIHIYKCYQVWWCTTLISTLGGQR